jgi:hypothetical protein
MRLPKHDRKRPVRKQAAETQKKQETGNVQIQKACCPMLTTQLMHGHLQVMLYQASLCHFMPIAPMAHK